LSGNLSLETAAAEARAAYNTKGRVFVTLDDISVIILTYNRPRGPQSIIEKLPPGLEIAVIDDGSDKDPVIPDGVIYESLRPKEGCRAASCRNRGIELTTRPKIVFLDDDVVPSPGLIFAHSLALQMYDVSLGLLCNQSFNPDTDERTLFFIRRTSLWRFCWTGNLAVRRAMLSKVGNFDTMYDGDYGYEDLDLGKRMALAGGKFILNHMALALHPEVRMVDDADPMVIANLKKFEEKWGAIF